MLCGCYKINIDVTVDKEGNLTANETVLLREDSLTSAGVTADDVTENMIKSAKESYPDNEVESVSRTIDDKKYIGYVVKNIDLSDAYKAEVKDNKVTLTIDMTSTPDDLQDMIDELNSYAEDSEEYADYRKDMEMTLTVNMPGKAVSNFGAVHENTVTIDLLNDMPTETVVISSELPNNMIWVFAGIAAVLVIGLAVYFLTRKKNKKPAEAVVSETKEAVEQVAETVAEKTEEAVAAVEEKAETIAEDAKEAVEQAAENAAEKVEETVSAAEEKATTIAEDAKETVEEAAETVKENTEE